MKNDKILIGKITSAHGIKGEVKVFPITDDPKRFKGLGSCFISKDPKSFSTCEKIHSVRFDRGNILISFEGVEDRDKALALKGNYIAVGREEAVKLPEDRFFIVDLIGLNVIDDDLGDLGTCNDVYETGANFVLSVKRKGKKDLQIPFLKAVCYDVDTDAGIIRTRLPDGLYDIYE
ncbi:MAG: 16S rRNA processing protein RimM [Clostridiales bacterium]|nr:16S rRNA processing protein RimM [Clostridiales bacterium]